MILVDTLDNPGLPEARKHGALERHYKRMSQRKLRATNAMSELRKSHKLEELGHSESQASFKKPSDFETLMERRVL